MNIYKDIHNGSNIYTIQYEFDGFAGSVIFYDYDWSRPIIVDRLIRSLYTQDHVEAIINNHFLNISEWIDKKFKGENVEFDDPEYAKLQEWRKLCKDAANEALIKYPLN